MTNPEELPLSDTPASRVQASHTPTRGMMAVAPFRSSPGSSTNIGASASGAGDAVYTPREGGGSSQPHGGGDDTDNEAILQGRPPRPRVPFHEVGWLGAGRGQLSGDRGRVHALPPAWVNQRVSHVLYCGLWIVVPVSRSFAAACCRLTRPRYTTWASSTSSRSTSQRRSRLTHTSWPTRECAVVLCLCVWVCSNRKILEYAVKSVRYDRKGISCVPPPQYAGRYDTYRYTHQTRHIYSRGAMCAVCSMPFCRALHQLHSR